MRSGRVPTALHAARWHGSAGTAMAQAEAQNHWFAPDARRTLRGRGATWCPPSLDRQGKPSAVGDSSALGDMDISGRQAGKVAAAALFLAVRPVSVCDGTCPSGGRGCNLPRVMPLVAI